MKNALAIALCALALPLAAQMKVQPRSNRVPLASPGAQVNTPTNFQRISIADAMRLQKEGKAVFIDVRSNEQFSYGHIKGAMSIPGSQLIKRFSEVPPKKTIITYCACSAEQSSGRAAADLMAHGVKNVYALKGGWNGWKGEGHPTAVGPN